MVKLENLTTGTLVKGIVPDATAELVSVNCKLSDGEARLYKEVTDYVHEQFNVADRLSSEGRRGTVGFALRLAVNASSLN
ncbi:MAG: hypothetical protein HYY24_09300 [Verrucomicrobia bacterium]|nr:hypothetical protein [Verrucomicrobiota bacterium]